MTTINNLTIEQMRWIVEGAPDTDMPMHYNVTNGVWIMSGFANRYFVDGELKLLKDTNLGHFEFKTVSINELRTAIAEHDEFKVGDLVVYHSLPHKRLFKVHNKGGDSIVIRECWDEAGARCFAENSPYVDIRHATPSEIKAGHRIDDNTDHVTDIHNHVSPNTKVIDHE